MDLNEIIARAYEIGRELLKEQKVSFSADELAQIFSAHYGSAIPFSSQGFTCLEALLEGSDFFERCPDSGNFRCVQKENYLAQYESPSLKGFQVVDSVPETDGFKFHAKDNDQSCDDQRMNLEDKERKSEEKEKRTIEESQGHSDESLDSDDEIRALQIAVRDRRKRARVSDPGPSRFSLAQTPQTPLSLRAIPVRSSSPFPKRRRIENGSRGEIKIPSLLSVRPLIQIDTSANALTLLESPTFDPVASLIDKIASCLCHWNEGEWVRLEEIYPVFESQHKTKLSRICKNVFPFDTYRNLSDAGREKFNMELNNGAWYFQMKEERSSHSSLVTTLAVKKITRCLHEWNLEEWVDFNKLSSVYESLYGYKLSDSCKTLFGPGAYHKLQEAGREEFDMKLLNCTWYFKRREENMDAMTDLLAGDEASFDTQSEYDLSPFPYSDQINDSWENEPSPSQYQHRDYTPSWEVPQPVLTSSALWYHPFQAPLHHPAPSFMANPHPSFVCNVVYPTYPAPPVPHFMNDPRLTDFAHRIRHILSGLNGHGYLPRIEDAYFQVFGSHLQYDFHCIAPGATLEILNQISYGEIAVKEKHNGRIHFHLKNFH